MSGWVERIFWTMAVASASGGVQISSTTISIPLALSSFSRSGLIPPWALISAMAISAPIFLSWPWRAHRPESGATSAILKSSAASAAGGASSIGAAASTASRIACGCIGLLLTCSSGCASRETPHAFLEVFALPHAVAELLLQRFARRRVVGDGAADLLLDRLHGGRAVGGDGLRRLQRPRDEGVRLHHAVDEPDPRRLRGVDQPGRQQQLHGVDVADLLDQLHGRAAERIDRPADLGEAEARVRRRRPDVGREQEFETSSDAIPVHCRNDW